MQADVGRCNQGGELLLTEDPQLPGRPHMNCVRQIWASGLDSAVAQEAIDWVEKTALLTGISLWWWEKRAGMWGWSVLWPPNW